MVYEAAVARYGGRVVVHSPRRMALDIPYPRHTAQLDLSGVHICGIEALIYQGGQGGTMVFGHVPTRCRRIQREYLPGCGAGLLPFRPA